MSAWVLAAGAGVVVILLANAALSFAQRSGPVLSWLRLQIALLTMVVVLLGFEIWLGLHR